MTARVTLVDSPDTSLMGRLANLSAHGLSLILERELPVDTSVKVQWGTAGFSGEVIYCQHNGHEFLAGLRVEDPVYDTARSSLSGKGLP
ncbi:MAG: PilZ domain-containing protein [Acidobacteriota bacterium]|jgi:hypothetical protein